MPQQRIQAHPISSLLWNESREGFVIEDEKGIILACSPAFAHMLGYAPNELIGRDWLDITANKDREAGSEYMSQMLEGKVPDIEMSKEYRHKHGWYVQASTRVIKCPLGVAAELGLPDAAVLIFAQSLTERPQIIKEITDGQREEIIKAAIGDMVSRNWHRILISIVSLVSVIRVDDLVDLVGRIVTGK